MSEILLIITKGEHTADISRGKNLKILLAHETSNNSQKRYTAGPWIVPKSIQISFQKSYYESTTYYLIESNLDYAVWKNFALCKNCTIQSHTKQGLTVVYC